MGSVVPLVTENGIKPSSPDEAQARAERIRSGMQAVVQFQSDVIEAFQRHDWHALGYESWGSYIDGEFGEHRVKLPRDERRQLVAGMREAGMSTRAIGEALGVNNATVHRDLSTVANATDGEVEEVITSLDGRVRPSKRSAPAPKAVTPADSRPAVSEALSAETKVYSVTDDLVESSYEDSTPKSVDPWAGHVPVGVQPTVYDSPTRDAVTSAIADNVYAEYVSSADEWQVWGIQDAVSAVLAEFGVTDV